MLDFPAWKKIAILGICLLGVVFSMPNLWYDQADTAGRANTALEAGRFGGDGQPSQADLEAQAAQWPGYLPQDVVNLGLDLRGGVHLLVEVQVAEVIDERIKQLRAQASQMLLEAGVQRGEAGRTERVVGGAVQVRMTNPAFMEAVGQALSGIPQPVGDALTGFTGQTDVTVTQVPGGFDLTLTEAGTKAIIDRTMAQSVEVMRRRIDETGTREPTIQRQGERRILIQVPGLGSSQELLAIIGKTAKLSFHEVVAVGSEARNPGIGEAVYPGSDESRFPGEPYKVLDTAVVTGDNLVDASLDFHHETGLPVVSFRFDTAGARAFGDYTAANVGRLFAVVLDEEVITAPEIQSPILTGSGIITGQFTTESATALAILLRSGALPASISVEEERTVGPDLGADSIAAGQMATLIAFAGILVFMVVAYGRFGVFANIALIVNIALIFAFLSVIGATLTLPGIAGIVLTIGMAVDANVLIFERIKEELKSGKNPARAVERGYEQALSAIIDANITTFLAAVILFAMGSGPVKGFAVTLGVGIVTSVFTATMVTRLMVVSWLKWKRPKTLKVHLLTMVPDGTHINFMGGRKLAALLSGLLVAASLVGVAILGLNFGIDFRGGTLVQIQTAAAADLGQIRGIVGALDVGEVAVQTFGSASDVLIRVEAQENVEANKVVAAAVGDALMQAIPGLEVQRVEFVGPKVSGELLQAGIIAVTLAVLAVLVYIWLRFEWQFGLAAVIALFHDVALTVGVFEVTGVEFNLAIIAALLTIVGYSLNDTVVVFDRVRENLRKYKQMPLLELMNLSLNETLSRTLMTSVTTLIALVALYVLGPEVIKGFTFAMIWGVVVGTYSSIFVAVAALVWLGVKRDWTSEAEAKAKAGTQFGGAQV